MDGHGPHMGAHWSYMGEHGPYVSLKFFKELPQDRCPMGINRSRSHITFSLFKINFGYISFL